MFNNIGEKIKAVTKAIFYIEVIISIIIGFIIWCLPANNTGGAFLVGLIVVVIGIFFAWLSSLLLYGYGELISKTSKIEQALNPDTKEMSSNTVTQSQNIDDSEEEINHSPQIEIWICPECCRKNPIQINNCKCGYEKTTN